MHNYCLNWGKTSQNTTNILIYCCVSFYFSGKRSAPVAYPSWNQQQQHPSYSNYFNGLKMASSDQVWYLYHFLLVDLVHIYSYIVFSFYPAIWDHAKCAFIISCFIIGVNIDPKLFGNNNLDMFSSCQFVCYMPRFISFIKEINIAETCYMLEAKHS